MTEQELFSSPIYYIEKTNEPSYRWNGKNLTVPGSYGHSTETRCVKTIGKFKVFTLRLWGGNGFGHNSFRYVVNTETNQIYLMRDVMDTYKSSIQKLKSLVETGDAYSYLGTPEERKALLDAEEK
ncbi:hypothetical protein D3C71_1737380 [compost metagenome]